MKPAIRDLKATVNDAGPPLSPLPAAPGAVPMAWRAILALILAGYLCVASVHALRTPVGATGYQDAPDEAAHVTAVRVIASRRLPTREAPGTGNGDPAPSYEWHQPPLYYILAAPFMRYGVYAVRFLTVVFGGAGIVLVYLAGRRLFPEQPQTAILAAGFVALLPGHAAVSSTVNNDSLLQLCFSGYILLLIVCLQDGLTARRSVGLGVILGAALLTKATAVLLIPLTIVALILFRRLGESRSLLVRSSIAIAAAAAIVAGWWFVRNAIHYHELLPLTAFRQAFEGTAKSADVLSGRTGIQVDGWPGYAALVAVWTFQSFFAVYTTVNGLRFGVPAYLPSQLYLLAGAMMAAATCGVTMTLIRGRERLSAAQLSAIALMVTAVLLIGMSFILFTSRYFQAQGRYFYPAILPIATLFAVGWRALFPPRYADSASLLVLLFLGAFCVAFLQAVS